MPKLLLVTPPLLQLNTPYPAVPMLTSDLRRFGATVVQKDLSLETALRLFSPEMVRRCAEAARRNGDGDLFDEESYSSTILDAVAFLQGRRPELAWRIATRQFLPEGPHFQALNPLAEEDDGEEFTVSLFGSAAIADRAKQYAALYLDDVSELFARYLDPDFGFGKYAEHLALALPDLGVLLKRLKKTTPVDEVIDDLSFQLASEHRPDYLGISVPFPGTLLGAMRIAAAFRKHSPATRIVLGGGYVNSELRDLTDERIFDFVDFICYDEGFAPWHAILKGTLAPGKAKTPGGNARIRTRDGLMDIPQEKPSCDLPMPDYSDIDLERYIDLPETANPMHRIWSDGKWLKLQLSRGCYWHKCAFCDVTLDYIGRYLPSRATEIADAMEALMEKTGHCGFHFVDEALAPQLLLQLAHELRRRNLHPVWWGNIRFDHSFTPEVAQAISEAGCIAVTGGLECANDRLLALMNKGITLKSARQAMQALADAGILVHAYLMYGFPTETRQEALQALTYVRDCFRDGILHSAFWHRFALTVHSPIARHPRDFGIEIPPVPKSRRRFALNEIPYIEPKAPDWETIGRGLALAVYNYMLGLGLDRSAREWLR